MEFFRVIAGRVYSCNDKTGDPVDTGPAHIEDRLISIGEYNAGVEASALMCETLARDMEKEGLRLSVGRIWNLAKAIREGKMDETGSIHGESGRAAVKPAQSP